MAHLPRYDEPQYGDEIALAGADGLPNNLTSKVQQVLASDFKNEVYEVRDKQGRVLYVVRVSPETWKQVYLERT